ncbi:MAG: hypothetical protein H7256_08545 [Bdellovibrio sp.]|nr:hypothetical protein [Bdellovibrio sp.]
MKNKLLVLCALVAAIHMSGCTSNQSQDESQTVENADVDKIEAENADGFAANATGETAAADPSLQAALGEDALAPAAPVDGTPTPEIAANGTDALANEVAAAPTLDESSLNDPSMNATSPMNDVSQPPPVDIAATNITEAPLVDTAMATSEPSTLTETPVIENSGTNTAMTETAPVSYDAPAPKKAGQEIKKIAASVPYKVDSGWVNAVYVARPGEKLKEISQKIYSSDKTKEMKKIAGNSYLKSRGVQPGDKVYYVSPNRPDDSTKTLFYYEDMGMVPETYVAQKGDTLRKVAKNILGYEKGSVELYSANPVESKSKLNEGETLRYWKSASGVTTVAMNTPPELHNNAALIDHTQMPQMPEAPPQPPAMAQPMAAMPPPDMNQMPPPPDQASALPPPPPPPPPTEMAPPPPVDDLAATAVKKPKKVSSEEETTEGIGGIDNDTMMSLGAVGVLTAALAFVLIRRKKKKAAESAAMMNETHIGS